METLQQRSETHAKRFKTFNVQKFMAWFDEHNADWQQRHRDMPIKDLSRIKRWENYQVVEYYRERRNEVHVPPLV